jgi:alkaline phosphatase
MAELLTNEAGVPLVFSAKDFTEGGNMVLWDDERGGSFPWDPNYFITDDQPPSNPKFDPEYIMQHAIDSANSASCYATGVKTGVNQMGVDLYELPVLVLCHFHVANNCNCNLLILKIYFSLHLYRRSILEDAQSCDKSGGIMSSVPILHATPGAFVTHTNSRGNKRQLQDGFREAEVSEHSSTKS